jgi:hypothetical protein
MEDLMDDGSFLGYLSSAARTGKINKDPAVAGFFYSFTINKSAKEMPFFACVGVRVYIMNSAGVYMMGAGEYSMPALQ